MCLRLSHCDAQSLPNSRLGRLFWYYLSSKEQTVKYQLKAGYHEYSFWVEFEKPEIGAGSEFAVNGSKVYCVATSVEDCHRKIETKFSAEGISINQIKQVFLCGVKKSFISDMNGETVLGFEDGVELVVMSTRFTPLFSLGQIQVGDRLKLTIKATGLIEEHRVYKIRGAGSLLEHIYLYPDGEQSFATAAAVAAKLLISNVGVITENGFKNAAQLWGELRSIPVDDEGVTTSRFQDFEAGTDTEDIWHWFEDTFNLSVAEDLMYCGKAA
jgi:hypothetical protein